MTMIELINLKSEKLRITVFELEIIIKIILSKINHLKQIVNPLKAKNSQINNSQLQLLKNFKVKKIYC